MDPNEYKLANRWGFYIHLQNTSDWSFSSYYKIMDILTAYDAIHMVQEVPFEMIKKTILFVMRDNVKPMWEDEANREGGGFSFRVYNKHVEKVWKTLFYRLMGGTLTHKPEVAENIMGISLSPKKSFCIIKIWMRTCNHLNHAVFADIEDLDKKGCLFKKHGSE
jgi:translation initiation factor 4E